jgi:hypothetical protein
VNTFKPFKKFQPFKPFPASILPHDVTRRGGGNRWELERFERLERLEPLT